MEAMEAMGVQGTVVENPRSFLCFPFFSVPKKKHVVFFLEKYICLYSFFSENIVVFFDIYLQFRIQRSVDFLLSSCSFPKLVVDLYYYYYHFE